MEISDKEKNNLKRRIMISRMRILCKYGFYGLLLMNIKFAVSVECETACTDCREYIYINPDFASKLTDKELDYVLMHEIMHVVLRHTLRRGDYDAQIYNIAADIVVNSNIYHSCGDDESCISIEEYGALMHRTPDDEEGYKYTVEEVYNMIISRMNKSNSWKLVEGWDTHINKEDADKNEEFKAKWTGKITQAYEAAKNRASGSGCGSIPAMVQRYINELRKPQTDWKQLLNEFVQGDINDYSFMPPDRRMQDSQFFLPDYNEREETIGNTLFIIDSPGSMSDEMITQCFSEIKGAIEQFGGKISGLLSFFDMEMTPPVPFENVDDLLSMKPKGGGGTSFANVFLYIRENMMDDLPENIVILTDGYSFFPDEDASLGIPVLWIIVDTDVVPSWGKTAYISL